MTTRKEEKTGGRQTVPERPFEFGTADHFVITWANYTLGLMGGKPFCTPGSMRYWTRGDQISWLNAEIMFVGQMGERLIRYRDAILAQPLETDENDEDIGDATGTEAT